MIEASPCVLYGDHQACERAWQSTMSIALQFSNLQLDGSISAGWSHSKSDRLVVQEIRKISRDQRNRLNSIREVCHDSADFDGDP